MTAWIDCADALFGAHNFDEFAQGAFVRYQAIDNVGDEQGDCLAQLLEYKTDGRSKSAGLICEMLHLGSSDQFYQWWMSQIDSDDIAYHVCIVDSDTCKYSNKLRKVVAEIHFSRYQILSGEQAETLLTPWKDSTVTWRRL